jgi:hypothetical protein
MARMDLQLPDKHFVHKFIFLSAAAFPAHSYVYYTIYSEKKQEGNCAFFALLKSQESGIRRRCDRIAVSGNRAAAAGKTVPFSVFSPKTGREILQS